MNMNLIELCKTVLFTFLLYFRKKMVKLHLS